MREVSVVYWQEEVRKEERMERIYVEESVNCFFFARYESKLKEARLIGAKKGTIVGLNYGVVYGLLFLMNATSFW